MAEIIPIPACGPPEPAPLSPLEKLLIPVHPDLAQLTSLSVRTLRRLDACGDIPGRLTLGRRVLFRVEIIRQWVALGLPNREQWDVLQKRNGKR